MMDETALFDVSNYLKEKAFDGDYSLFDDKNGGLFAKTPKELSPRDQLKYPNDKNASFDYDDIPDYPYDDLENSIDLGLNDEQGLSIEELEWLSKSEDEIRNKIFELAEEIQRETKEMHQGHRSKSLYEYGSEKRASIYDLTSSRDSVTHSSPDRNEPYLEYHPSKGSSARNERSSESERSSPELSSYVPPSSSGSRASSSANSKYSVAERMSYLSLDSKPAGLSRTDRFPSRTTSSRSTRSRDAGLVDWRVAARTAEQNAQRQENALGYDEFSPEHRCQPVASSSSAIGAKRRLCRHFLKGFCNRGDSCDFLHDNSIFCPDEQKVFLGGLPTHMTADSLCTLLKEMNYTVINKPKILRGFTPQVCLSSIAEAQELIRKRKIYLDNTPVDVRPYEDRKPPDDLKRSVFLGGLAADTTVEHIQEDLAKAGFPVENNPILKAGFVPQVVLESVEKAQELIKMAKIRINGKNADVRPYVNFRKRY